MMITNDFNLLRTHAYCELVAISAFCSTLVNLVCLDEDTMLDVEKVLDEDNERFHGFM